MDFSYPSINQVRDDLGETGNDARWLRVVKEATDLIETYFGGPFYPYTETRRFDGPGGRVLYVNELLSSAPTIVNDTTTLAAGDYVLYGGEGSKTPRWRNGPYTRIEIDPDAASLTAWDTERDNITVAGKWGWWDETEAISGATVQDATQQAAGSTTLTVQTGKVEVGMVLLIGTELEFVTALTVASPNDTATVVRGVLGTTDAAHLNGVAIRRQVVPQAILALTIAAAGRLWKWGKSGYTGRTLIPELGAVNILDTLPKDLLKLLTGKLHPVVAV